MKGFPHCVPASLSTLYGSVDAQSMLYSCVWVLSNFWQILPEQVQEEQERSKAAAAKHDSVLQQLNTEHAHTAELDSQIETQHKVCLCIYCSAHSGLVLAAYMCNCSGSKTSARHARLPTRGACLDLISSAS